MSTASGHVLDDDPAPIDREEGLDRKNPACQKQHALFTITAGILNMPDWIQSVVSSRTLSLLVAIVYVVMGCLSARSTAKVFASILIFGGALLFPLACIWFADELGEYVGALPGPGIDRRSPAWMVKVGGWILLLLPAVLFYFTYKS